MHSLRENSNVQTCFTVKVDASAAVEDYKQYRCKSCSTLSMQKLMLTRPLALFGVVVIVAMFVIMSTDASSIGNFSSLLFDTKIFTT